MGKWKFKSDLMHETKDIAEDSPCAGKDQKIQAKRDGSKVHQMSPESRRLDVAPASSVSTQKREITCLVGSVLHLEIDADQNKY